MHSDFRKYYFIENFDTKNLNNQDKDTIIIYRNYKQDKFDIDKLIKLREADASEKLPALNTKGRAIIMPGFAMGLDVPIEVNVASDDKLSFKLAIPKIILNSFTKFTYGK